MKHFKSLSDLHATNGMPAPEHPLFSMVRCRNICSLSDQKFTTDFYMIGFKKLIAGVTQYGRTQYDHSTGSMIFVKPRQIIEFRDMEFEEDGFMIYIHEDYLLGHDLHTDIDQYAYFDYVVNEALHISPREEQVVWELFEKMHTEYRDNPDEFSKEIILLHVESLLKYAQRFYKRQFINRSELSGNTLSKFNTVLEAYFKSDALHTHGLPTVQHLATSLNLSPRYLSDLLKQETGKTAIDLIHLYVVHEAKELLAGQESNVSEVAYALGFDNLPYFSKLFKKETGFSPSAFRKSYLN